MIIAFTYSDLRGDTVWIYYGEWGDVRDFKAWADQVKGAFPNAKAVPRSCLDRLHIKPQDCKNILLSDLLARKKKD